MSCFIILGLESSLSVQSNRKFLSDFASKPELLRPCSQGQQKRENGEDLHGRRISGATQKC